MQKVLSIKIGVILLIAFVLLIPLNMISGKISERNHYFYDAKNAIASSWTGPQTLLGPIVVVPYVVEKKKEVWDEKQKATKVKVSKVTKKKYLFPRNLEIESVVSHDSRYKGIYKVPVYTSAIKVFGQLEYSKLNKELAKIESKKDFVSFGKPYLSATVSDPRGINRIPELVWQKENLQFNPGSKLHNNSEGIHAYLPSLDKLANFLDFSFELELRGMETISFVPVGSEVSVDLSSSWPHPKFSGNFLPSQRTVDETGYKAQWNITSFASNVMEKVKLCERGNCNELLQNSFGVTHIEPVDVYLQSERSVKYGFLFIGLTFVAFFVFEIMKRLPIHAIQYTLVGFAIAIFYLLLVSLSEHIDFGYAYLIASISCASLLLFYLRYVLREMLYAISFSAFLMLLYGVLYVIIQAEDFALLMGATLTFLMLGGVMVSTRNVDWYEVGERIQKRPAQSEAALND